MYQEHQETNEAKLRARIRWELLHRVKDPTRIAVSQVEDQLVNLIGDYSAASESDRDAIFDQARQKILGTSNKEKLD